ncbi:MAG TPA: acyltransferase [Acidobacteriaceae bacterium]
MPAATLSEAPTSSKEVFTIQVLRAAAALFVILRHVDRSRLAFGSMGVDIFFVLSGFVMILSTARLSRQPGAARIFLRRRIVRIIPMYWLFTAIQAVRDVAAGPHVTAKEVLCSLLFIPYRFGQVQGSIYFPVISVGWTLNYEAFFYVCFAVCLLLRRSAFWMTPLFVGLTVWGLYHPEPAVGAFSLFNYRLLIFTAGMLLARLYMARRILRVVPASLLLCAAVGAVCFWSHDTYWPHMLVWAPAAVAGTYALLSFEPWIARHTPRLVQLLGDASYSIYLSHLVLTFAFLHAVMVHLAPLRSGLSQVVFGVVAVSLSCLVGIGVHFLIERRILRYFAVRLGGHPATQAVLVPAP